MPSLAPPPNVLHELRCNGIMLKNRHRLAIEVCGQATVSAALSTLQPALAQDLAYGSIVAGGFYPIAWLRSLHAALAAAAHAGPELARRLGYLGAKHNFTTVHRIFFRIASPRAVIERVPRVHKAYFDGGTVKVMGIDEGRSIARWEGCRGFDRNIWESMLGGCEAALELSRAKHVRVRFTEGGGNGDDHGQLVSFWA